MSINLDFSEGGRYFIHVDEDTLSVFVSWTLSNDVIGMDDEFQYIHYTFPRKNRLANVRLNPDNPGDTNVSYGCLPNGDRISRANDTETIYYLHDRDNVIAVLDTSGNPIETYLHGKGIDEPVAMNYNAGTHAFVQDGLGSTVATVFGGAVLAAYRYDAWGNLEECAGPMAGDIKFLFTGREYDWQTGVYYYRARSYDANLGRFLQPDPAGMVDGPNMYAYCGGDPVNNKDPGGTVAIFYMRWLPSNRLSASDTPGTKVDPSEVLGPGPVSEVSGPEVVTVLSLQCLEKCAKVWISIPFLIDIYENPDIICYRDCMGVAGSSWRSPPPIPRGIGWYHA